MDAYKVKHSLTLLSMLKQLQQHRFVCDVEVKVGDEIIPAHKAVLAASSDYFVTYFNTHSPSNCSPIEVSGISAVALRICLNYMYEGVASLSLEVVEDVLEASKKLRIRVLSEMSERFLASVLSISNCLEVVRIAKKCKLFILISAAEKLAVEHSHFVIQTDSFRSLHSALVTDYLNTLLTPEQKWKGALVWLKNDFMDRQCNFPTYLEIILPKCRLEFLLEVVWSERPVMDIPKCSSMVASAIFKTVNPSNLSLSNCLLLLEISVSHPSDCPDDKKKFVLDFVAANLDVVAVSNEFKNLVGGDLLSIIKSPNSRIFSPENIWQYVVVWIKCDLGCRKKFLRRLIRGIKWQECSFQYFLNQVFNDFLVKNSKSLMVDQVAAGILLKLMKPGDIIQTNWYSLLRITRNHGDVFSTDCLENILTFAAVNFAQISVTESFGKVSCEDLNRLLQNPEVRKSCTDQVKWQAAINWVKRDVDNRKKSLYEILKCLDLDQWNFKFLCESVRNEILVTESAECKGMVVSVVFTVLTPCDITIGNCYELLSLAKQYSKDTNSNDIIAKIHQFFAEYYSEITQQKFFVRLEWEAIEYILNNKLFQGCQCELKWMSVWSWLRHDVDRKQYLSHVLEKLRLDEFPFSLLEKKVSCLSWVQDDEHCDDLCVSAMLKTFTYGDINIVNWYNMLVIIKNSQHSKPELRGKIEQFMAAHFDQISHSAHFIKLSLEEIIVLLNSPEITSTSPEYQMRGVLKWFKENGEKTENDLIVLMKALRLEGFPFTLLFDNIRNEEVIKNSRLCTELLLRGIRHALKPSDVTIENWHVLFQIVKDFSEDSFQGTLHIVLNFVASKFQTLHRQNNFNNLSMEDLCFVLESRDLRCNEEIKSSAILQWVEYQESARWTYLPDLLALVNLSRLDRAFIRKKLYDNPMVKNSDACREMILQSLMGDDHQEVGDSRPGKRDRNDVH